VSSEETLGGSFGGGSGGQPSGAGATWIHARTGTRIVLASGMMSLTGPHHMPARIRRATFLRGVLHDRIRETFGDAVLAEVVHRAQRES
jgi:hypothetical protein